MPDLLQIIQINTVTLAVKDSEIDEIHHSAQQVVEIVGDPSGQQAPLGRFPSQRISLPRAQ